MENKAENSQTRNNFNHEFWDELLSNNYERISFSFEDELTSSSIPYEGIVLLGKNDHVVDYQDQLNLINTLNDFEVTVLNDAGHNVFMDSPKVTNFYLSRFVQLL